MPDLVSLADAKTFLGISASTDDDLITDLLEHVEALFESETGRTKSPFTAAATARTEVKDGTGLATLYLDYPISALTSVKLGYDSSDPVETLDTSDPDTLTFATGSRRLARTDGGVFGLPEQARYVTVVYNHQANLPEDAQLAIKRMVAQVYRQRGSEDASQEGLSGYTRTLATSDAFWRMAVAAHRRIGLA